MIQKLITNVEMKLLKFQFSNKPIHALLINETEDEKEIIENQWKCFFEECIFVSKKINGIYNKIRVYSKEFVSEIRNTFRNVGHSAK